MVAPEDLAHLYASCMGGCTDNFMLVQRFMVLMIQNHAKNVLAVSKTIDRQIRHFKNKLLLSAGGTGWSSPIRLVHVLW